MLKEIPIKFHRTLPPAVVKSYDHCAFQVCGIACLSDFLVDNDIAEGKLIPLLTEQTANKTLPFNAVYYSDKAVNLRLRVFLDFLVEELRG